MMKSYEQGYLDGLYSAYNAIKTSEVGALNVVDDLIQSAIERV